MKVILLQDVPKTGKKGEIVEVSDGYARNFLMAKKLAAPATKEGINAARNAASAESHRKQIAKDDAKKLADSLQGKSIVISARAGEKGKLFGAITGKEIADEVEKQLNAKIDKRNVELSGAGIKQLGEYEVVLRVYAETTAKIIVKVEAQ